MLIKTVIKQILINLKPSATTVAITTTKSQILQIQTPQKKKNNNNNKKQTLFFHYIVLVY